MCYEIYSQKEGDRGIPLSRNSKYLFQIKIISLLIILNETMSLVIDKSKSKQRGFSMENTLFD